MAKNFKNWKYSVIPTPYVVNSDAREALVNQCDPVLVSNSGWVTNLLLPAIKLKISMVYSFYLSLILWDAFYQCDTSSSRMIDHYWHL